MSGRRLSRGTAGKLTVSLALGALAALAIFWTGRMSVRGVLADPLHISTAGGREVLALVAEVRAVYEHDPEAFTQGLLWYRGKLYESTGTYGGSSLREVEPTSGEISRSIDLAPDLFGEGLERVEGRLVQLTWREGIALEWDLETFTLRARHTYSGEGWGLCYGSGRLIRSDGSDRLFFHDPGSFEPWGSVTVRLGGLPLRYLNELECAEGAVYANILGSHRIARIDPGSGEVTALIDASGLVDRELVRAGVLNGIAYNRESGTFYLTGKYWPKLFEVVFVPAAGERTVS